MSTLFGAEIRAKPEAAGENFSASGRAAKEIFSRQIRRLRRGRRRVKKE